MKRIFCVVLALLLAFSLAACQTRVPEDKPEEKPEEQKPLTAQELWAKAEELQEAYTSTVYTMTSGVKVNAGEIAYETEVSLKAEEFDRQSDNPSFRVTQTMFGQKETYTYVNGTAYADLALGSYQQQMTPEVFYAMAIADPEETDSTDITPAEFGKVEIVKEDESGYTLAFSEPSEALLAEMFDTEMEGDVQMSGEVLLDAAGHYKSLTATATQKNSVGDQETEMVLTLSLVSESFNQPVAIGLPTGATKFAQVEQLKGLATISKSLITQNGKPTGTLYKVNSVELAADGETSVVQQHHVFGYFAADPLVMNWAQEYTENGESYASVLETYQNGTYTFTVDGEEEVLDVSEADVRAYIKSFPQDWLDAPAYATGYAVTEEAKGYTFTIALDEEYTAHMTQVIVEELLNEELAKSLSEAEWTFSEQQMTMTATPDIDGVAIAAKFVAKVTLDGESLDLTIQYALAPFESAPPSAT